jgi:TetR/AcrR family transcriptional regulator, transcriptional repressor for nem operon
VTARPRGTADRILDLGERFVMERGYHAWSYQHVADALAVKPAAIHYHFRTKPELVAAVLDRYRARFARWGRTVATEAPLAQLDAYVALSRGLLAEGRIDPFGMMAAEYSAVPPEVQERLRELQSEIFGWFGGLLARGRDEGAFAFDGPAPAKAAELACALLGAQQLGRVCGAAAFEEVADQLGRSLGVRR